MTEPQYASVELSKLREPTDAHRLEIDPDELHRLADSMAANGLHQAAAARGPLPDGTFEIIWGHRRLLAARLLRWDTLHCRLYPADTDPEWARLDENNIRADLSPLEEARQVARVKKQCHSDAATARYFRRSLTWVTARLDLIEAPEDIQLAVHTGKLSLGVARCLATIDHEPYRLNLIEEAHRNGATAHTAEIWKQHWLSDGPRIRANFTTVEEIVSRREAWVYYVPCGTCAEPTDFTKTTALRMCHECNDAVLQLIERATAEAAAAPPQPPH